VARVGGADEVIPGQSTLEKSWILIRISEEALIVWWRVEVKLKKEEAGGIFTD
jgi:hypothetical protein